MQEAQESKLPTDFEMMQDQITGLRFRIRQNVVTVQYQHLDWVKNRMDRRIKRAALRHIGEGVSVEYRAEVSA